MIGRICRRKKFARETISNEFLRALGRTRNWQTRNSFLVLYDRIRSSGSLSCFCDSGHPRIHQIEPVFESLINLADANKSWIRDPSDWYPAVGTTFRSQIASLLRYLLATHRVPPFMDHVWWSVESSAKRYRKWFRHLGRGHSIRGIVDANISTRQHEQRFLNAPSHYSVDQAIFWARREEGSIPTGEIYPAGQTRRRRKRRRGPEYNRLWHRIGVRDFCSLEEQNGLFRLWQIKQLRHGQQLKQEAKLMQHCVASYQDRCEAGKTTIWSMTRNNFGDANRQMQRALTIEVLPDRTVNEALGFRNRNPKPDEMSTLQQWASCEELRISPWVE